MRWDSPSLWSWPIGRACSDVAGCGRKASGAALKASRKADVRRLVTRSLRPGHVGVGRPDSLPGMRMRTLTAVVVATLLSAGCGDGEVPAVLNPGSGSAQQTAPQDGPVGACSLFSEEDAADVLAVITRSGAGTAAVMTKQGDMTFETALSECHFEANDAQLVIAVYGTPCDFYDVATEPTVQISTDPAVYRAGNTYACGNIEAGSAVALVGGALRPVSDAQNRAAWIDLFTL